MHFVQDGLMVRLRREEVPLSLPLRDYHTPFADLFYRLVRMSVHLVFVVFSAPVSVSAMASASEWTPALGQVQPVTPTHLL